MRLIEFNERDITKEQVKALVNDDASVSAGSSAQMFRGTNYQTYSFVGEIRTDRKSRHSGEEYTMVFNVFMDALGLQFRKSNTLSVTLDRKQATEYGNTVYMIYPFNGSSYLYSGKFSDLLDLSSEIVEQFDIEYPESMNDSPSFRERELTAYVEENARHLIHQFDLHVTDDPNEFAHKAIGEVLVLGHKYLAITTDTKVLDLQD